MSKIISQKKDLICIILGDLTDDLNYSLRKDKPNIQLIDDLNDDIYQYENVIVKFIN